MHVTKQLDRAISKYYNLGNFFDITEKVFSFKIFKFQYLKLIVCTPVKTCLKIYDGTIGYSAHTHTKCFLELTILCHQSGKKAMLTMKMFIDQWLTFTEKT